MKGRVLVRENANVDVTAAAAPVVKIYFSLYIFVSFLVHVGTTRKKNQLYWGFE